MARPCAAASPGGDITSSVRDETSAKIEQVVQTITAAGGSAEPVLTDATSESDVLRLFDHAAAPGKGIDPCDLVVFNAGNNQWIDFRQISARSFEEF